MGRSRKTSNIVFMRDKVLGPYFIEVNDDSYNLYNEKNKKKCLGYFTSLSGALTRVCRLRTLSANTEMTIRQYIRRYNEIRKELKTVFDETVRLSNDN